PYLPIMKATSEWSQILANENDFVGVIAVARDAIATSGVVSEWTWVALMTVLICAGFVALIRNRPADDRMRGQVIFAAVVFFVAAAGTIGFLCAVKYLVFPRYFLAVLAVGALCVNIFWNAIPQQTTIRAMGLCL